MAERFQEGRLHRGRGCPLKADLSPGLAPTPSTHKGEIAPGGREEASWMTSYGPLTSYWTRVVGQSSTGYLPEPVRDLPKLLDHVIQHLVILGVYSWPDRDDEVGAVPETSR